ncbi:MAG: RNA methyltransferase [Acidobacteria bacterium]|nr:RNA methyltransferase [Acidobacteriota bacterium]
MLGNPKNLRIVLVRPRNPLNIAAAARAMQNFGFDNLAVVAPYEPVWKESRAAPGAEELLQTALVVPSLLEAVEDRTLVLGTSSLARRKPSLPVLLLNRLEGYWKESQEEARIAVIFGPEKTGLRNEDLSFCHSILQIPTAPQCPSMNLGQAVAVCCYEFWRLLGQYRPVPVELPVRASVGEVVRLAEAIESLRGAERPETAKEWAHLAHLRETLLHWPMTSQDVTLALGVVRDLSWRVIKKP